MSQDPDPLLPGLPPPTGGASAPIDSPPRYETANRTQIELTPTDLDALLAARSCGAAGVALCRRLEPVGVRRDGSRPRGPSGAIGDGPEDSDHAVAVCDDRRRGQRARGRPALCRPYAYRWIRGGVSVNYHTLSDFRVAHHAALDDLLTQSIATLRHRGVVTLARVAQDGTRVRASAGAGSFRREGTLRECLKAAEKLVARTQRQTEGGLTRAEAAQARAAADRLLRVEEALAELPAVAAAKARSAGKRKGRAPTEARASTTDPEARVMKMADGGFRPAYNVQFATDHDSDVIVGVAVTNASDQHELVPMLTQVGSARRPARHAAGRWRLRGALPRSTKRRPAAVTFIAPVPRRRGTAEPVPVQPTDSPAVAAWRARMQTDEAKQQYRYRGAIAERVNADARTHRTLNHILVRGLIKVHSLCALDRARS